MNVLARRLVVVAVSLVVVGPLLAFVASPPRSASACAAVSRDRTVRIAGEEAVIVWDPARRTQHFVRTAAFEGASADFGFLVPTPSRPELAEVDDGVFQRLFALYRRPVPRSRNGGGGGERSARRAAAPDSVVVLERRTVAGLDTAVLAASDAGALDRWLAQHGYASGPELAAWLRVYVQRRWIVTAFRIDPGAQRTMFGTRAVRMSFATDTPFFPYSEPRMRGARPEPRPFRVSVIAPERMRVRRGARGWRGRVGFAAAPGERLAHALGSAVPAGAYGASSWLTVFDEPASVRSSDDLFFEPDTRDRAPVPSSITTQIGVGSGGGPLDL